MMEVRTMQMQASAPDVPVVAGTISIRALVTLTAGIR
jgi:hypothetical protein